MTLPDFLIIGAQKAGTTWLRALLRHHPNVYMPDREIHFFNKEHNYRRGLDWYARHFRGADGNKRMGKRRPTTSGRTCRTREATHRTHTKTSPRPFPAFSSSPSSAIRWHAPFLRTTTTWRADGFRLTSQWTACSLGIISVSVGDTAF
jgi:hypothetical protein